MHAAIDWLFYQINNMHQDDTKYFDVSLVRKPVEPDRRTYFMMLSFH